MSSEISSQSFSLNQDPSSIFYIHPTDQTSQQLVSTKFNGKGYSDWKRSMLVALSARNKLKFVTGAVPRPSSDDKTFSAWERCNDLIVSWLLSILSRQSQRVFCIFKMLLLFRRISMIVFVIRLERNCSRWNNKLLKLLKVIYLLLSFTRKFEVFGMRCRQLIRLLSVSVINVPVI